MLLMFSLLILTFGNTLFRPSLPRWGGAGSRTMSTFQKCKGAQIKEKLDLPETRSKIKKFIRETTAMLGQALRVEGALKVWSV